MAKKVSVSSKSVTKPAKGAKATKSQSPASKGATKPAAKQTASKPHSPSDSANKTKPLAAAPSLSSKASSSDKSHPGKTAAKTPPIKPVPSKSGEAKSGTAKTLPAKGPPAKEAAVAKAGGKSAPGKSTGKGTDKPAATLTQAPAAPSTIATTPATPAAVPKPTSSQPPRPIKRPKAPPPVTTMPPGMGRLMDPKNPIRKPLIPSGPKATAQRPLGAHGNEAAEAPKVEGRSPFGKREVERFRVMLIRKRAELVGDVNTMESEALLGQSGSMSNSPSHMAEQGSEAYDQSLSLDLAAADRKLIKEIDDAIERIRTGVYGLCQISGKPIKVERLEELPWARYSIEAARELERQAMRS